MSSRIVTKVELYCKDRGVEERETLLMYRIVSVRFKLYWFFFNMNWFDLEFINNKIDNRKKYLSVSHNEKCEVQKG